MKAEMECQYCGGSFNSRDELNRHNQSAHPDQTKGSSTGDMSRRSGGGGRSDSGTSAERRETTSRSNR